MSLAIIGLCTALVPLLLIWVKSKLVPTVEQRTDSAEVEVAKQWACVAQLEAEGNLAAADALRRRLLDALAPQRDAGDGTLGQQLPPDSAGGHADPTANPEQR